MMEVSLIDKMGDDLRVVNAARVSFSKQSDWETPPVMEVVEVTEDGGALLELKQAGVLKEADRRLIYFLARGMSLAEFDEVIDMLVKADDREEVLQLVKKLGAQRHWAPFSHCMVTLRVRAPIYVARQLFKHKVGFAESEVSRRYVDSEPDFYTPDEGWRERPVSRKQGSGAGVVDFVKVDSEYKPTTQDFVDDNRELCLYTYNTLLESGVAPEQARGELPQSMLTEWIWTGSLEALARMYRQRADDHAQKESQILAKKIGEIVAPLFPVSWEALTNG